MKVEMVQEVHKCDGCGAIEHYMSEGCLGCGKEFCYECKRDKDVGVEYKHGVNFSGSGDGFYCHACDKKAAASGDKLHAAYVAIRDLRLECAEVYKKLEKKREKAESNLKALQGR